MRIQETQSASLGNLLHEAAETTRLRILNLLRQRSLCVAELQQALGLSEPMISRHLARLRYAHLVEVERRGQRRIYRLTQNGSPAALVLEHFLADIAGKEPCLGRDSGHLARLLRRHNPRFSSATVPRRGT